MLNKATAPLSGENLSEMFSGRAGDEDIIIHVIEHSSTTTDLVLIGSMFRECDCITLQRLSF